MTKSLKSFQAMVALATALVVPVRAHALFHISVINEMVTSYNGDDTQQFIEIKMLFASQNLVANAVIAAFDESGAYITDVLVVPANVPNGIANRTWIAATSSFQTATGFTADFTMPAGLPVSGGMVCWGAPGILPPPPGSWDHAVPTNYVDCLAYGTYHGPTNLLIGTPTKRAPVGHSLQRGTETNNNSADFSCANLTPTNNADTTVSVAATIPCNCGNGTRDGGETCDDGNQVDGDCCSASCTAQAGSCDDGNACTLNDACVAGACVGTPSSDPACTLDHFHCYKSVPAKAARRQPPFPAFTARSGDSVQDQFGPSQLDLKKGIGICNPADKNGENPAAPNHPSHLESYKAKLTRTDPAQVFAKGGHHVQNQFGMIKLTLLAVDRLMVPSSKVLGPGGAPPYTANDLDHFKCYKAAAAKGEMVTAHTVTIKDELGGPLSYDLKKPTRLCAPADKDGEDPTAPSHAGHLVCYQTKLSKLDPPQPKFGKTRVSTNNQFGPEVIDAIKVEELCVPSLKLD